MTNACLLCGGNHDTALCPSYGTIEAFLQEHAPRPFPPDEPPKSSTTPPLFEQLYGEHAEPLLLDVLDAPQDYSPTAQQLAMEILNGEKHVRNLNMEDQELLDEVSRQLAAPPPPKPAPAPVRHELPPGHAYQKDMEDFDEDELSDLWPIRG